MDEYMKDERAGQMALCLVCAQQDRIEDNGRETICTHPRPDIADDECAGFRLLAGIGLGQRLAELYNLIDLVTDVVYALAELVEQRCRSAGFELSVQLRGSALADFTRLHELARGLPGEDILVQALAHYREFEVGKAVEAAEEEVPHG